MKRIKQAIIKNDKTKAVELAISMLESKEISIVSLYQDVLSPALSEIDQCTEEESKCIWKEHIRTNIVRTIIESAYTYVAKYVDENNVKRLKQKALVVCPTDEYHEIGARMATDFLMMTGYDVKYIGANTPLDVIVSAVEVENPTVLAVSVTNLYHLSAAKHMIDRIRELKPNIKIYAGGQAFSSMKAFEELKPDKVLYSFDDFLKASKEVN